MKNLLIIKGADFSNYAIEKVSLNGDVPTILFGLGGTVTIEAQNAVDIYYTTNGVSPTINSTKYVGTFSVSGGTEVKAISVNSYGDISPITSAMFNAIDSSSLYKVNYTLGFTSSSSTTLTDISLNGYGITGFIQVPSYSDLNINFGANIQTLGMWNEYYKFKVVEYTEDKTVVTCIEERENVFATKIPLGNPCIWSVRDGTNNVTFKNVTTQEATHYIRFVVKLDTSANITDKSNGNVLFQYIP